MEPIKNTLSRIHPLVAAAAVSVIIVSLAGTAAITGILPSSHGAPEPASMNTAQNPLAQQPAGYAQQPAAAYGQSSAYGQPAGYAQQDGYAQQGGYAQPLVGQPVAAQAPAPAPVVIEKTVIKEVPVKQPVHHHTTSYAHNDGYYAQPARPVQHQPNYMAIGTGAVIGGLVGNQVGSGNGRKLATVAGVIGGGLIGNQIANQNR